MGSQCLTKSSQSENGVYYTEPGATDRAPIVNDSEAPVKANDFSEAYHDRPATTIDNPASSTHSDTPSNPPATPYNLDSSSPPPPPQPNPDSDALGFNTMSPTSEHAPETRLGISDDTAPYSNSTSYGSGTTGGPGHGNKTVPDPDVDDGDAEMTRFGSAGSTAAYSGGTEYGSGTTAGPG